jgi:cytochrome bd-type quinol oxidase subunit 2
MIGSFLQLSTAFGLSSAAGLNAYIPLLILSIMANRGIITLAPEYDLLKSPWIIALLVFLCLIELVVDKIPGADHVNDMIQTLIRPAAGALLFASQTGAITYVHPGVFIVVGILTAGTVHGLKSAARPVINLSTFGIGAPVASTFENLTATFLTVIALIFAPRVLLFMIFCGWLLYRSFKRFTRPRPILAVSPIPAPSPAPAAALAKTSPFP